MSLLGNPWAGKLDLRDPASGPDVESWFDEVRAVVNALDDSNIAALAGIKLSKLEAGVWRNTAGVSAPRLIQAGTEAMTLVAGTKTNAIVFPTAFASGTPVVTVAVVGAVMCNHRISVGPSTTGFTIILTEVGAASGSAMVLHWQAAGVTA